MLERLFALPMILLMTGMGALAMLIPSVHALTAEDFLAARSFFYAFIFGAVGVVILTLATGGLMRRDRGRSELDSLLSLFLGVALVPLYLALPFYETVGNTTYINAYFEMVSSLTTTGATLYAPERLSDSLHLWRGLVGWMGGLLIWVTAAAVLAPLNLGGYEVTSNQEIGQSVDGTGRFERAASARRLRKELTRLLPVYLGLTLAVFLFLLVQGDRPLVAAMHAMATLSTSGISPTGGIAGTASGAGGEMVLFLFMLFALSRMTFSSDTATTTRPDLRSDPEFRLGLGIVIGVPLLLFGRHWLAALETESVSGLVEAGLAIWGGMFTVLSFLTTTGFESQYWHESQVWSGLDTPGVILLGLAMIGGGVATTAGGVKLLRVYALYLNGRREMERLLHPSSVGGSGLAGRRFRRQGAFVAWVFFMLFALSLTGVILLLALMGQEFEAAIVMTVAALSTCGPLIALASDVPIYLNGLGSPEKLVLCAAMVLGRLEILAIIALFNPALWRR